MATMKAALYNILLCAVLTTLTVAARVGDGTYLFYFFLNRVERIWFQIFNAFTWYRFIRVCI